MKDREKMCDENYPDCKNCPYPILPLCKWQKKSPPLTYEILGKLITALHPSAE